MPLSQDSAADVVQWWVFYRPDHDAQKPIEKRSYQWTCNKDCRIGEYALVYTKSPMSALTEILCVESKPRTSKWAKQWSAHNWGCKVRCVKVLANPLPLEEMQSDEQLWAMWGPLRGNLRSPGGRPPKIGSDVLRVLARKIPELAELLLLPPRSSLDVRTQKPPGTRFGGGEESPAHRQLKQFVADHPDSIGLKRVRQVHVEYAQFKTGDTADILFELPQRRSAVVEVEVADSKSSLETGMWQAMKYRLLTALQLGGPDEIGRVDAFLVAPRIPDTVQRQCRNWKIQAVEVKTPRVR